MRNGFRPGKALPIILAACVLVSGGVGTGVGLLMGKKASASAEVDGGKDKKKKKKKHEAEPQTIHSLGEMVINLADTDTLRYAKASVTLGFEEKVPEEKMKEITPILRDQVLTVLSRKRFTELHKIDGTMKAKEEIREALEEHLTAFTVTEVYFEGFCMQ